MERIEKIYEKMKTELQKRGSYDPALDPQLLSLAGAVKVLMLANEEIDGLDSVTVERTSRYGSELVPHPAFRVLRDAQDTVSKQMKMVGLTVEDLGGDTESDPLMDLTQQMLDATKGKKNIKPRK